MIKEIICIVSEKSEKIYQQLKNFEFWKIIWITSCIYRFFEYCKRKEKLPGPVKTNKTEKKQNHFEQNLNKEKLKPPTTLKKIKVD